MTLSALLALLSAVPYGAADFMGGLAARRASTIAAVVEVYDYHIWDF